MIYADRAGIIRWWNATAEAIFGFSAPEAVGQSLDLVIPERLRAAHWRGWEAAMARGATRGGAQARLTRGTHNQGLRLYVEMSFGLVVDADGTAIGAIAIARDVTEQQSAARARPDAA